MIRENAPQLKNLTEELFKDSDFEDEGQANKEVEGKINAKSSSKKDKPVTYKDLIRKDILENNDESS